ncbi:MAG: GntR family transcriptional regulator [Thermoleophilia bacterium]|nr:GntR family transcriptional regulator [Thermoleophilia bacterium]
MNKIRAIDQPLSLTRLAYKRLRETILSGQLKAGEIYNEMALAREMGVSRTPVREALLELSSQGLVTFLPRKGVQVNYFDDRDVEEVFELRKLIELAAVEKAVVNGTAPDWDEVEEILQQSRRAAGKRDLEAFLQADRRFHHQLVEVSRNSRMHSILDNLRDLVQVMSYEAINRVERMDEVVSEHDQIMRALRAGKAIEARDAMATHLDRSERAVLDQHRALMGSSEE